MSDELVTDFLEHHGVKGMKWGIRNELPGVSRKTNKLARKDAEEYARAQMYYGEGAGIRRKLIKSTVDARKKKDPTYARAFEHHLSKQDMSYHARKAINERSRKDKTDTAKKTSKAVARKITGEMGTAAALIGLASIAYMKSPKLQRAMKTNLSKVQHGSSKVVQEFVRRKNAMKISDMIKNMT